MGQIASPPLFTLSIENQQSFGAPASDKLGNTSEEKRQDARAVDVITVPIVPYSPIEVLKKHSAQSKERIKQQSSS